MKGSLYANFVSKRNFADVLTTFRLEHLVEMSAKFLSIIKLAYSGWTNQKNAVFLYLAETLPQRSVRGTSEP